MPLLQGHVAVSETDNAGFIGRIPVRNLWLLMLYASELFRTEGQGKVGTEQNPDDLPDLVAEILAHAVERRQRRRLNLGFRSREAVLNRVRGRIDVLRTERHQLLERGLVACRFGHMTIDTLRNRFVRAALERISGMVLRKELAHRCRTLAAGMKALGVSGNPPTRAEMSTDRFGRNDAEDRFMVAAAKLAFDLALPTERAGTSMLNSPEREEAWVRRLFERAVGGFYAVVLSPAGWRVRCGSILEWPTEEKTEGIGDILPKMHTDIVLEHAQSAQRIVIDTKFTSILKRGHRREKTLHSAYIYQIYAYLRSQSGHGDPAYDRASGILLHPAIGEMVDEAVTIQGHRIRFATLDLATSAAEIRSQLLGLIKTQIAFPTG